MAVSIRQAERGDADLLYKMICDLARYEEAEHCVKVNAAELRQQLGQSPRPFECVFAESDGTPCGFALYFYAYSTWEGRRTLYLEDLFVSPEFRGVGAGVALMEHLSRVAQQEKCGRFEWSVLDWNAPAIAFYNRLGAKPVDGWTRYRIDCATAPTEFTHR